MVLDHKDQATYAEGLAAALRVLGPTPRAHALGMLHGLQLGEQEALEVLAFAIACRLLMEDGALVRARPSY